MALYVYLLTDGTLVSWCPDDGDPVAPDEELKAKGLAVVRGLPALDETHEWDAAQATVVDSAKKESQPPDNPDPIVVMCMGYLVKASVLTQDQSDDILRAAM